MKKFSFVIDIVAEELDRDAVVSSMSQCLTDSLPSNVYSCIQPKETKSFSVQGFKVWRARVTGVDAKTAGDAHNSKVATSEADAVAAE